MISNKSRLILTAIFLALFLWSCVLVGKGSVNLISIFIFALVIKNFATTLVSKNK